MSRTATPQIVSTVFLTFICYLCIGLPLAVLPSYVHGQLGFGSVLSGLTISVQYLATLSNRAQAGRMADVAGPKRTVLYGLIGCAISGAFLLGAAVLAHAPWFSLASLLASRVLLGLGESLVGTGAIMWAIGRVGPAHTSQVISWNGIASYGAVATGAPLGVAIETGFGFLALGACVLALGLVGVGLTLTRPGVAVVPGNRLPFRLVFWRVLPHGLGLALASTGFGTIATFITLYYASRDWSGAAIGLSVFGLCFIGARLLFGDTIPRFGGFRVAIVSLAVETVGLLLLFGAGFPFMALLGAAVTGTGFALVFPALGVEAVDLVPGPNRGAALGAYSVFFDLSLGLSGPMAGLVASHFGYASIFLFGAVCTSVATLLSLWLYARSRGTTAR